MTLYILNYNNYYNRIVKKEDSFQSYVPFVIYGPVQGVYGFTPGDGVNTTQLLGSNVQMYNGEGDYLIAVDEDSIINSRWFIIDTKRERNGQWTLTLHRDLIVDFYNNVLGSPMYIEKAILTPNDPFIYNKENNMSFNQIKTNEWQITDKTEIAWIVGFLDRKFDKFETGGTDTNIDIAITNPPVFATYSQALEQTSLFQNKSAKWITNYQIDVYTKAFVPSGGFGGWHPFKYTLNSTNPKQWTYESLVSNSTEWLSNTTGNESAGSITMDYYKVFQTLNGLSDIVKETIMTQAYDQYISDKGSKPNFDELLTYDNETIATEGGSTLYNVTAETSEVIYPYEVTTDLSTINGIASLKTFINNTINGIASIAIRAYYSTVNLQFNETQEGSLSFQMLGNTERRILSDAPYDMFCIPYGSIIFKPEGSVPLSSLNKQNALSFSQQLAQKLGTNLYDIQLLPYCPMINYLQTELTSGGITIFDFDNLEQNKDYQFSTIGNKQALILWSKVSRGEVGSSNLLYKNWSNPIKDNFTSEGLPDEIRTRSDITNTKIANECNIFRLCSPNWNGQFEFNPAKFTNNTFSGFNVDFTYLPYSSYIHVAPVFSGLYGQDFNDARGLICQGDFSISYESGAFEQYQINNKNYLNTFNRQIQNMEVNQSVQRDQQIFNAIAGTVMGGAAGATMGSKAGAVGAVVGAAAGTLLSAAGGALDVHYGDILRNEALDYTKDQFGYQLDNIKALPDSIAKVTAYTENNKLFPTLEFYTCTEREKEALANKIAYNGMTVMRIGSISEFIGNTWSYAGIESKGYIKGKLIRLETVGDDYHIINALSGELDKGVYIT